MNICKQKLMGGGKIMTVRRLGKVILSQLLCIGAVFTACTDDEVVNQTNKTLQVSVSTEAPAESRAIIDGGYLPDGASIGVTLTAEDGSAYDGQTFSNLQYTAAGEGSAQTWSSATPASLSITAGKVIAYYPYYGGDDFDLKAVPVETASQTDYMYAKPVTGINMVSPSANLTMQHAMTDIRINVKKGTYTGTGEVTKITAKAPAFATTATMDVETGVFANVSGSGAQFVQELTGAAISSGNVVQDFLIVPDVKSTSGEVSIFVIIDGKKFAVNVPYTECFQQGFTYTYNLTLDNAALTLDGVSVSKWGVKAEVDESLKFYDDQYIVEIAVPSDNYEFVHNIDGFTGAIDWGDGTISKYEKLSGIEVPKHTYVKAGNYTVVAEGKINGLYNLSQKVNMPTPSKIISKLISIGKDCEIIEMESAFYGQKLLSEILPGALDGCTEVTNFEATFAHCTGLTEIPQGLFDNCTKVTDFGYENAYNKGCFRGCTGLQTIPEGLFDACTEVTGFESTFYGCKSLTSIPEGLFKNNTKVKNFKATFRDCSSLETIGQYCFKNCLEVTNFCETFTGCSNLQTVPERLFDDCTKVTNFDYTFFGTAISSIPKGLFDKCPEVASFYSSFAGCTSLQTIPEGLFDKCTKVMNFSVAFEGCTKLQTIPVGLFDHCTKVTNFLGTFKNCEKLQTIPEGLFDNCPEVTKFSAAFAGCKSLTAIPQGLFDNNTKVTEFGINVAGSLGTFYNCTNITEIPEGLFDACTKVTSFRETFYGCASLQSIPEGLFDHCTEVTSFGDTFNRCESLTEIPEGLFDNCPEVTDFVRTFRGCKKLQKIPEGLFDKCTEVTNFYWTFDNCSDLQAIPEGLFDYNTKVTDFSNTFYGCSCLKSIPTRLFDNNTKVTNFYRTFMSCINLQTIPAGLFDKCTEVTNFCETFRSTRVAEIPEGLFDKNTKVTSFEGTFEDCDNLQTIPVRLFDNNTKVTNFANAFWNCDNLMGESPYTIINVNGEDTKVHLYERVNYPEYFTAPTSYSVCYRNCTQLTDYSTIPSSWL